MHRLSRRLLASPEALEDLEALSEEDTTGMSCVI